MNDNGYKLKTLQTRQLKHSHKRTRQSPPTRWATPSSLIDSTGKNISHASTFAAACILQFQPSCSRHVYGQDSAWRYIQNQISSRFFLLISPLNIWRCGALLVIRANSVHCQKPSSVVPVGLNRPRIAFFPAIFPLLKWVCRVSAAVWILALSHATNSILPGQLKEINECCSQNHTHVHWPLYVTMLICKIKPYRVKLMSKYGGYMSTVAYMKLSKLNTPTYTDVQISKFRWQLSAIFTIYWQGLIILRVRPTTFFSMCLTNYWIFEHACIYYIYRSYCARMKFIINITGQIFCAGTAVGGGGGMGWGLGVVFF